MSLLSESSGEGLAKLINLSHEAHLNYKFSLNAHETAKNYLEIDIRVLAKNNTKILQGNLPGVHQSNKVYLQINISILKTFKPAEHSYKGVTRSFSPTNNRKPVNTSDTLQKQKIKWCTGCTG